MSETTTRPRVPAAVRRLVAHPVTLWVGFLIVHVVVAKLALDAPGRPMSDVLDAYAYWMSQAFDHHRWAGIDYDWVYPVVALVPLAIARLIGGPGFPVAWLAMVTAFNAIAFLFIVGWRAPARRAVVAWWWLAFILLLGPIALARLDTVTMPVAIVGVLLVASRPAVASVILTVATWIKVWPAALLLAMVIALRARLRVVIAAAATSAVIVGIALLLGAGTRVIGFVSSQTGRGLQIEAPITTPWMWMARAGVPGTQVFFDDKIATYEIKGPWVDVAAAVMTPVLAVAFLAVVVLAILAVRRGAAASGVLPLTALALVTAFIAFNKVGSPQYMTWLAVPVVLGLATRVAGNGVSFRVPAVLVAAIALLTQVLYPFFYGFLVSVDVRALVVISLRDVLLFTLVGWAAVVLARLPVAGSDAGHDWLKAA